MLYPRISIVILNWNGWKDTIECLESLYYISYPNFEIFVVDNASQNDSIRRMVSWANGHEKIMSHFFKYNATNKPIKFYEFSKKEIDSGKYSKTKKKIGQGSKVLYFIKNDKNYGFAEGNNIIIRRLLKDPQTEYILLLNNDTVVKKNFLNELVSSFKVEKHIGIVGSKILYYDYKGFKNIIQSCGAKINLSLGIYGSGYGDKKFDSSIYSKEGEVDYITGACQLISRECFLKIGEMETRWFMYFEDTDLCMRARRAGFKTWIQPKSIVWHKLGSTSSANRNIPVYFQTRNLIWFERKYANKLQLFTFTLYFFIAVFSKYIVGYLIYKRNLRLGKLYVASVFHGFFGHIK